MRFLAHYAVKNLEVCFRGENWLKSSTADRRNLTRKAHEQIWAKLFRSIEKFWSHPIRSCLTKNIFSQKLVSLSLKQSFCRTRNSSNFYWILWTISFLFSFFFDFVLFMVCNYIICVAFFWSLHLVLWSPSVTHCLFKISPCLFVMRSTIARVCEQ